MRPQERATPMNVDQLQNTAMNVVELFCAVFSMPIDVILRFRYGSRYFPPTVMFFAWVVMLFLPMVAATASPFSSPLFMAARIQQPQALFDIDSLSKLFFLLCAVHGVRSYRLMFKMELEQNSRYEGPPLFFFNLLPWSNSFWFCRIVIEPAFVLLVATFLERLLIFSPGLAHYLQFAALCLTMKNFIGWFKAWEFLREILDARYAGPVIAKFVDNTASQDELNSLHLSSLPKDISPELRRSTAIHIARIISPGTTIPE